MAIKSFVSVAQGVEQHLKQVYKAPERAATRKSRSGTEILTDLYARMDDLIAQIDVSDDTPAKKAIAYGSVARILQQLQTAEANAAVHIDKKALSDMTAQELESLVQAALKMKGEGGAGRSLDAMRLQKYVDSPSHDGSRTVNTASLIQNKKSEKSQTAEKNKKQQERAYKAAEARRRKAAGTHLLKAPPPNTVDESGPEDVDAILDEIVRGL